MGFMTLTVVGSTSGIVIRWPQAGHWICVPARVASASSSCLQLGHTNVTSIRASRLELNPPEYRTSPSGILAKSSLIGFLQLFDSRGNRRDGGRALFDRGDKPTLLLRVACADYN